MLDNPESISERPSLNRPAWGSWNKRPTISIFDAICVVHNIGRTDRESVDAIDSKDDPRVKRIYNHLQTLRTWVRNYPNALPVEPNQRNQEYDEDTYIAFAPYIKWVKEVEPFPKLKIPEKFFTLTPPMPEWLVSPLISESSVSPSEEKDTGASITQARAKSWARLLIAILTFDYKLLPTYIDENGNFQEDRLCSHLSGNSDRGVHAPLADFCREYGIPGLSDSRSVKKAIEDAMTIFTVEDVERLLGNLDRFPLPKPSARQLHANPKLEAKKQKSLESS